MALINYCYCPLLVIGEIWTYMCFLYFTGWEKVVQFFRRWCCCCRGKQGGEDVEAAATAQPGASNGDRADATEAELQPFLADPEPIADHGTCCESKI
uniref:G_PROTEIN_RECEP_F1_2 domain-containing protein n=1 Tax=Caenorhabditis tropicalis TaxID=1561998 RepID=A0A1I7TZV4_9PELO